MNEIFPVNIHSPSGTMICALAYREERSAMALVDIYNERQASQSKTPLFVEDDFGHRLCIPLSSIGYMIYVDKEKDAILGEYVQREMAKAQHKQDVRAKIVAN